VNGYIIMSLTNEQLWRNGMSDVPFERGGGEAHCQSIPRDIGPLPPIALTKLGGSPDYMNYDPDFAGDIHEVLIYNKILSVQERGMVESYMLNRYNIAATAASPGAGSVITPAARLRIERDAVGNLTVTPQFAGEYRLQVTSLDGRLLRSVIASGACQVARATLPSGLCLVRVEGGGQVAVRRIVVW
jgi:hypothetical protein